MIGNLRLQYHGTEYHPIPKTTTIIKGKENQS
jgi:hypothetical protein